MPGPKGFSVKGEPGFTGTPGDKGQKGESGRDGTKGDAGYCPPVDFTAGFKGVLTIHIMQGE